MKERTKSGKQLAAQRRASQASARVTVIATARRTNNTPPLPPFSSLSSVQPNEETREKQLKTWCDLLLAYARHTSMAVLDVDEATAAPPFRNDSIKRALPRDGIVLVLDTLAKTGQLSAQNGWKQPCSAVFTGTEAGWVEFLSLAFSSLPYRKRRMAAGQRQTAVPRHVEEP